MPFIDTGGGQAAVDQRFSVFLSAVTREFGAARDALADALQARGIDVKVQRSFDLGDDTTLAKLHDYIRGCDRVVAVVGDYCGMFPPEGAVPEEFREMLPAGMTRASLTQWEVIFARHYRRETFFFEAARGFAAERPPAAGDDKTAQAAWRHWLFDGGIGRDRRQFDSAAGLRADVMGLRWPDTGPIRPSNLPGSIGHLFKGRETFLDGLRERFRHRPTAAITGKAVHGLGGVGKTRTAIEYGHAHAAEYAATLFLAGKSASDLQDGLAALAGPAVLDLPERDAPDLEVRVAAVIRWLRATPGWLLIIDNADDETAATAVRALLDRLGQSRGHVLITSRVGDWGHMVEPVELDLLTLDAAKDLLRESTPHRTRDADEEVALARLAELQLGCLALALVQAAAHIDDRRMRFADYGALFEKQAAMLLAKLGKSAVRNLSYPLPVAATWQASFAQLSDAGRLLLDMLAWLSIEPIPRSLFDTWPDASIDLEEGLAELTRYSLVHWEEGNSAITLHRLVARVTRDNLDEAGRDRALEALFPWIYVVNREVNADDVRCWPQLLPLLPHVLVLFERTADDGPYPHQTDLYDEYATLLQSLARYSEAELLHRRALAIDEAHHAPDHPEVAIRLNNLAQLLLQTNRLTEAEPIMRRALAIDECERGPNHPQVAIRLNNLAGLLRVTNRFAEAEPLFRRAIAIDEMIYGPDHPEVATDLNNLAGLLLDTNRQVEAELLFRRSLAIDEVSYGPDHPRVATALNNLAELLRTTKRYAEAEPLFRRALAVDEMNYGADHLKVAIRLNNLAGLLIVTNRLAEAEPLYRRTALIMLQLSRASGHLLPNMATALRNYEIALISAGRESDDAGAIIASVMIEADFDPADLWPQVFRDD